MFIITFLINKINIRDIITIIISIINYFDTSYLYIIKNNKNIYITFNSKIVNSYFAGDFSEITVTSKLLLKKNYNSFKFISYLLNNQ